MKIEVRTPDAVTGGWANEPKTVYINPARIVSVEEPGLLYVDGWDVVVMLTEQSRKDVTEWLDRYTYYLAPYPLVTPF